MSKSVHQTINALVHGHVAGGNICINHTTHQHALLALSVAAATPTRRRAAALWLAWALLVLLCVVTLASVLVAHVSAGSAGAAPHFAPPTVALVPVQSTAVAAVGYDPATRQLYIVFTSSAHPYTYCAVPVAVFEALLAAPSLGQFYNAQIRGRFGC